MRNDHLIRQKNTNFDKISSSNKNFRTASNFIYGHSCRSVEREEAKGESTSGITDYFNRKNFFNYAEIS